MYKKGDKYEVTIDSQETYFRYTHDVVDFIIEIANFPVDYYELKDSLKNLDKSDFIILENNYVIKRIA